MIFASAGVVTFRHARDAHYGGRPTRHIEYLPLPGIARAVRNPKKQDLPTIRTSFQKWGCTLAGDSTAAPGRLVGGHRRLLVLEELVADGASPPQDAKVGDDGLWLVLILRGWSYRSDADAEGRPVANNAISERGGRNRPLLSDMLTDIGEADQELLAATRYDLVDVEDLLPAGLMWRRRAGGRGRDRLSRWSRRPCGVSSSHCTLPGDREGRSHDERSASARPGPGPGWGGTETT